MESTIKLFSCHKHGRDAFQVLISEHAGKVKRREISKKRLIILQNIKWNSWACFLESHVSNNRQATDDMLEFSTHIDCAVSGPE